MRFHYIFVLIFILSFFSCGQDMLYKSKTYKVIHGKVVQGQFEARAESATKIISNYKSDYKVPTKREMFFKFSINGGDNERFPGEDHRLVLDRDKDLMISEIYAFGEPDPTSVIAQKTPQNVYLEHDIKLTIRCDMRHVLKSFEKNGFYITKTGEKIQADDFQGVYAAGSTLPLTWEFDALTQRPEFKLSDADGDGIYEITLHIGQFQQEKQSSGSQMVWTLQQDISSLPQYQSPSVLLDALYNLSLEEMLLDVRQDGAFMAGKKWPGVWTRDISYSILLAMAAINPDASKKSLMAKVKNDRIIQDTGTGGSWPVSTDRMTWALAAWEVYAVTGDQDWLEKSYRIIKNSAFDDLATAFNENNNLFYGESSFLDWREQTYPRWMDPKDIYVSQNLGTCAVHYQTYRILETMADILGENSNLFSQTADRIKKGVNDLLWLKDKGYYGQFLYGRHYLSLSPKSETLGEALCILFGIADKKRQKQIVENTPVIDFGPTCIFPQIPNTPPYHNNGIWPFVVEYWTWAAAKAGNETAVKHGLGSIYRQAALFLTNQENMVAQTGDYMGTEINSSRQLWSVAANLATVYRVFYGMQFNPNELVFQPFVPKVYKGTRRLSHFTYRQAVLDITLNGFGNEIASVQLDGQHIKNAVVSGDLKGQHELVINLSNKSIPTQDIHLVKNQKSPETPVVVLENNTLIWNRVEGASTFHIFKNGELLADTKDTIYEIDGIDSYSEYQVLALNKNGLESFLSEPVFLAPENSVEILEPENESETKFKGYSGQGYVTLSKTKNRIVRFHCNIKESGQYSIDFRYANGNGPINTNNKCAIRSIYVDNKKAGTVIMAQRGTNLWADWGFSNALHLYIEAGKHNLTILFEESNNNMHGDVNVACLDYMRVIKL